MTRFLAAMGAGVATATLVIVACNDTYEEGAAGPAQGTLDGACYANSTCNEGLTCSLVAGRAQCRPTGATSNDAASASETSSGSLVDSGTPDGPDAKATPECSVELAEFPCGAAEHACIAGDALTCVPEGFPCEDDAHVWACESPKKCEDGAVCCLGGGPVPSATGNCSIRSLTIPEGSRSSTSCRQVCGDDEARLCAATLDCLPGTFCQPFKIEEGPAPLLGRSLGICVRTR